MDRNEILTIEADFIRETSKSYYLDCEGDLVWFPKKGVVINKEKKEVKAPRWLLQRIFPGENF